MFAYISLITFSNLSRVYSYEPMAMNIKEHPDFIYQKVTTVQNISENQSLHIFSGITSSGCNEPLTHGARVPLDTLHDGPVDMEYEGFFNLRNPACMLFPSENHCTPGDHIALTDRENFERFRRGDLTTWHMSASQRISNIISIVAFFGALSLIFLDIIQRLQKKVH